MPNPCGCRVERATHIRAEDLIIYCDFHAAAETMLAVCEEVARAIDAEGDFGARAAIAEAKGER